MKPKKFKYHNREGKNNKSMISKKPFPNLKKVRTKI